MTPAIATEPVVGPPGLIDGDDLFYEIVHGQRVELAPMSANETVLATRLVGYLEPYARTNQLGRVAVETLFGLDPTARLERRPDVAFVSKDRWPLGRPVPTTNAWDVVPNLAVEVISKTNLAWELVARVREYFTAGVQLVWVVYPTEGLIYVYNSPTHIQVFQRADELDSEPVLPGFRLPVAALLDEANQAE